MLAFKQHSSDAYVMTEAQSTTITAMELWDELQSQKLEHVRLVIPVGALVRSVPIVSIQGQHPVHGQHPVIGLHAASGEVLTFTASDHAEIKRTREVHGERHVTRYDVTFPLGDYFTLISG